MRIKNATWYECKLRYSKTTETGDTKKTTDIYVVDALSFTEAESLIINAAKDLLIEEFELKGLNEAQYKEILFSDKEKDDTWFKVKLCFTSYDEVSGKEKKSLSLYLVQAKNIKNAMYNVEEMMKSSMIEYNIQSITQTNIKDVFQK